MQIFINEVLINIFDESLEFSEGVYAKVSAASTIIGVYEEIKSATAPLSKQYHFEVIDYDKTIQDFKSHFKVIKAAGGIVTKKDKILFIKRLGKWDFPKGKIDKGEEEETAAVREVAEECGVSTVIKSKIGTTWHTYLQAGQDILKKTVWFEMECVDDANLKPQIEEGIATVEWVKLYKAEKQLANTYQSIRSIYQTFLMKKMKKLLKAMRKKNKETSSYLL